MELEVWDILLGGLTILSAVWAFISEQYRLLAIIISFILLTIVILSKQSSKIGDIIFEQKRLEEKLKIHEMLIEMKAEIKYLQKMIK